MKEIGGYFEFEDIYKEEYHKNLIRLNTARNAMLHILKLKILNHPSWRLEKNERNGKIKQGVRI
jgi:hypothetical protein